MLTKSKAFFRSCHHALVAINDTPHRIALGFGIGIFFGVIPGAGPIAALVVAILVRANRAAALMGCLLTNTWLSIVTFVLSVKIGSWMFGLDWHQLQAQCKQALQHFQWSTVFKESLVSLLLPLVCGYSILGVGAAIIAYGIVLIIALRYRTRFKH